MGSRSDPPAISLTLGSRYHVRSLASRENVLETAGIFRGVVSVGSVDGLALELGEAHGDLRGKLRVIPSHVVLSIDILEAAVDAVEKSDDVPMHYS